MLFSNLKKIPPKKCRKDKGKKGSHPNQSMWHRTRTEEEKKAYSEKISAGMKRFYAQRKAKDLELKRRRMSEGRKAFFRTPEGREDRKYRRYLASQYYYSLEDEERKRYLAKRGAARKREWDTHTPEERKKIMNRCLRTDELVNIFEFNVPRKKNFCGVVREDKMYG